MTVRRSIELLVQLAFDRAMMDGCASLSIKVDLCVSVNVEVDVRFGLAAEYFKSKFDGGDDVTFDSTLRTDVGRSRKLESYLGISTELMH